LLAQVTLFLSKSGFRTKFSWNAQQLFKVVTQAITFVVEVKKNKQERDEKWMKEQKGKSQEGLKE
jgi:hypothetical protein